MLTPHTHSARTPHPLQHCRSYKRQLCHLPLNDGMMEAIDRRLQRGRLIRQLPDSVEYIRNTPQHTAEGCDPYWASMFLLSLSWEEELISLKTHEHGVSASLSWDLIITVHPLGVRVYGNKVSFAIFVYWLWFIVLCLPVWQTKDWCSEGCRFGGDKLKSRVMQFPAFIYSQVMDSSLPQNGVALYIIYP